MENMFRITFADGEVRYADTHFQAVFCAAKRDEFVIEKKTENGWKFVCGTVGMIEEEIDMRTTIK